MIFVTFGFISGAIGRSYKVRLPVDLPLLHFPVVTGEPADNVVSVIRPFSRLPYAQRINT